MKRVRCGCLVTGRGRTTWLCEYRRGAVLSVDVCLLLTGSSVKYIDQRVTKGAHYVTCEIAANSSHPLEPDASHFRLVAVMAT